jgi:DNA-binding NarL/FixJ family response regulator
VSGSKQTMPRARVLLADDHKETAEQLHALLRPHFDVVALVEDGRALVSAATRLTPDVIVADISMPGLDGIEASALIRRSEPEARIVLVTVHSEPILVQRGLAAGALGYVLKDSAGDELVAAVHAALAGDRYVSRALGGREHKTGPD